MLKNLSLVSTYGKVALFYFYGHKREPTLYYLLREQGCLTILKFLPHSDLSFHVINEKIPPTLFAYYFCLIDSTE